MDFQTRLHHFRNHHFQTCSDIQQNLELYLGCLQIHWSKVHLSEQIELGGVRVDTHTISANGWYEGIYDRLFDLDLGFDPTSMLELILGFLRMIVGEPGNA